ncbi:MAG: AMP-binding protein [Acidocella sp.]|nr:AMP-binding protein [Acidocella sp.]
MIIPVHSDDVSDSAVFPTRPVRMAPRAAIATTRADGAIFLESTAKLADYPESWNIKLRDWAAAVPDRVLLTEPDGDDKRRAITYAETLDAVRHIGEGLLALGLDQDKPLAILAENSIDCAMVTLAALWVGIPASPISPAYALKATEYSKLQAVFAALGPGGLYIADGNRYGAAVAGAFPANLPVISSGAGVPDRETISLASLRATPFGPREAAANAAVTGDTVAKILFTSGSSGAPKPVIQPHGMLAANRQQNAQAYAFMLEEPPVMVDWLPWHHTFGGNNNFGFALWCGGTFHIDPAIPGDGNIARSVALLSEHPPSFYLNTPGGFTGLIAQLASNTGFRQLFFSRLKLIQYGGAVLPLHLWRGLDDLAVAATGTRILIVSGLGSTECGPTPVQSSWEQHRQPEAGLPLADVQAKLVPTQGTWELRLRGPCITPGYWRRPDLTAAAFDENGFFLTGDAVKPVQPENFAHGLLFDGRISDNFKLSSGTWVQAPKLRTHLINALAPLLKDAVITGPNRDDLGAIGFPDMAFIRQLAGESYDDTDILFAPELRGWIIERLQALARDARGSSERIVRLALEIEAPSIDNGELTDKGVAAARMVIARRAAVIDALHGDRPDPRFFVI